MTHTSKESLTVKCIFQKNDKKKKSHLCFIHLQFLSNKLKCILASSSKKDTSPLLSQQRYSVVLLFTKHLKLL